MIKIQDLRSEKRRMVDIQNIKEKLIAWNLLNTNEDYRFFKEIEPLLFFQKLERFGDQFVHDYLKIMNLKTSKDIRRYIESVSDSKRKILIADTYFNIMKGQKIRLKSVPL